MFNVESSRFNVHHPPLPSLFPFPGGARLRRALILRSIRRSMLNVRCWLFAVKRSTLNVQLSTFNADPADAGSFRAPHSAFTVHHKPLPSSEGHSALRVPPSTVRSSNGLGTPWPP